MGNDRWKRESSSRERAESAIRATPALNGSKCSFFFSSLSFAVASCLTRSWKRYRKLWVRFTPRHVGPEIFWMGHADVRTISLKTRHPREFISSSVRYNVSYMYTHSSSCLPFRAVTKYKGESNFSSNARFPPENSTRLITVSRRRRCRRRRRRRHPSFSGQQIFMLPLNKRLLKNFSRANARLWNTTFLVMLHVFMWNSRKRPPKCNSSRLANEKNLVSWFSSFLQKDLVPQLSFYSQNNK